MLPILYQSPDLILYSYPLLMGLGWGIAYQIYFSLMDQNYSKIKAHLLFWGIFAFSWLGAKIFFVLNYSQSMNQDFIQDLNFWTGGGFVFYGGLIGALIFLAIFRSIDRKLNFRVLSPMLPALVLGHAIGRIGCFLAGCCFGRPTDHFWGIYLHDHYRHPTQLIEALALFMMGLYFLKSHKDKFLLFCYYLIWYGTLRLIVEALRGDIARGQWGPFTPSQWISTGLLVMGFIFLILRKFRHLRQSK